MATIGILDLNFMTYTYHSTPQASMYVMLISGWHKAKKDTVSFLEGFPPIPRYYDKIYIVKDRIGVGHLNTWLIPDNVIPVGNFWAEDGIEAYYNEDWETTPPDNTIYWGWLDRWKARYPKYNENRLEHFYRTPVKIKQKGKLRFASGSHLLIIDNDLQIYDKDFEFLSDLPLLDIRFTYPIPIDGRWNSVLEYIKYGPCNREYLYIEMNHENYSDEEYEKAAEIWAEYNLGRMPRLLLNFKCTSNEEWKKELPRVYKALAEFRMKGGKMVRVQPFEMETFKHPRILQELKRWSGRSVGYAKNSLFDYILFDSVRDTNHLKSFLIDPYQYVEDGRFGTNKLHAVLDFIEEEPELFRVIIQSYPRRGN